jgi:hypothetical protein
MTTTNDLYQILLQKVGYEVVVPTEEPGRLRLMGRIPADKEERNMGNWKLVMDRVLEAAFDRPWTVDISKNYFKKGKGQPVVFAWRIIFAHADIAQHYADIVNIIRTAPSSARTEVTEMPLPGSSVHRNSTAGGKRGAGVSGSIPVGPLAAQQKNMGG